jgi:hypothetical protein
MTLSTSTEVKDAQTNPERARAAIKTYQANPDERNDPRPEPVSRRPHLDVDAVLARSLRSVAGE